MADDAEVLGFLRTQTDPAKFAGVEREFRREFGFCSFTGWAGDHATEMRLRAAHLAWLAANPNLAPAFIFHGDGKVRQAALMALKGPLLRPVVAYGLISRLNDWAPEVRSAANDAFARCFPQTPAETLLPALTILFQNARRWTRWDDGFDTLIAATLQHQPLTAALVQKALIETTTVAHAIFHALSRHPDFEVHLPKIAATAHSPALRAAALTILAQGKVAWPLLSRRKVWIDKSAGVFQLQFDMDERPLSTTPDLLPLLETALQDRAARVRLIALDALTARRTDPAFHPLIARCLATLPNDDRPSIKGRLDYLRRSMARQ